MTAQGDEHRLVQAARALAETLERDAAKVEREGISRARLDLVAKQGLIAPSAPVEFGGLAAPPDVARRITELLASACGTTWFVVTQHRSALDAVLTTENVDLHDRWRRKVCSGQALGAVAFAHLRRPGPPQVVAEPHGEGWRFTGHLDWVTGWGVTDVLALMAETTDGRVVETLIPARQRAGLSASGPLPLMVMGGTRTVAVQLNSMLVTEDEVVRVSPLERWHREDTNRTVNTSPAVFGLLDRVSRALIDLGEQKSLTRAVDAGHEFALRVDQLRTLAYHLVDEVAADDAHEERLRVRAMSLLLAHEATAAMVAATGGSAIALDNPAQRWAREALFFLVQAQTGSVRDEMLGRWPLGVSGS